MNHVLKNNISILTLSEKLKNSIEAIFYAFWVITQKNIALLKFQCHFCVSQAICFKMLIFYVRKVLIIWRYILHKMLNFGSRHSSTLYYINSISNILLSLSYFQESEKREIVVHTITAHLCAIKSIFISEPELLLF